MMMMSNNGGEGTRYAPDAGTMNIPEALYGLAADAVGNWLASIDPSVSAPVSSKLIAGGHSNLTYELRDAGDRRLVLRRPPLSLRSGGAHDMGREFKIIAALAGTAVPVPRPVAHCADESVIGAPFFVMEFVGGNTIADPPAAGELSDAARRRVGEAAVDALVELHRLDVTQIGLGDLIRPGSYFERQLRRWAGQLDTYPSLTTPLLRDVGRRLGERIPRQQRTSLVHGDYKMSNLRVDEHGEVVAVLDWELTAVGDPLADLGWLLASWPSPSDAGTWIVPPPSLAGGFLDASALAQRYGERSGLHLGELDYYVAFAQWRWSCINERHLARIHDGSMADASVDPADVRAQILFQAGEAAARLGMVT